MIILYRENFRKDVMSELLSTIEDIRPNWTYSFDEYSEADVRVVKHTGRNIVAFTEELVEITEELVIALVGEGCISECPIGLNSGMTGVKEHIITYIEDRGI